MNEWACPTCKAKVPGGERPCHCSKCHHTFWGLKAFDKHRHNFVCIDPHDVPAGDNGRQHTLDHNGAWHWGAPKTVEQWRKAEGARRTHGKHVLNTNASGAR